MIVINSRFLTQKVTGVQRFAIELCLRLKEMSDDLVFVCPKNIENKLLAKELDAIVIGTHVGHLWEQYDLPKWLKSNGSPLLINLANTAPLFYSNKISTIHDIAFEVYPQTFSKIFLLYYKFLIPRIARTSKKLITVSEFSKKELIKYYDLSSDLIEVIYNSVSKTFSANPNKDGKTENDYILAVSSLNYRKNFIYILESFKRIQTIDDKSYLYIVGDLMTSSFNGIDLSEYEGNPRIKFLGRISDEELVKLYRNALCFVYPSLYEGFGIPPLEAQACNCPVICSNSSCLPEVFGDSVLYCNPHEIDTLVEQISFLLNDDSLREKMINLGRLNTNRYSWQNSAERLYSIIKQL